jgi:hypothetical protein
MDNKNKPISTTNDESRAAEQEEAELALYYLPWIGLRSHPH